jgi:pyocin large subunit-like protein
MSPTKAQRDVDVFFEDLKVTYALVHWNKHAKEFPQLLNAKQYVDAAKSFFTNSPAGTLVKIRANGEILKYYPPSNTFAVMDASGS